MSTLLSYSNNDNDNDNIYITNKIKPQLSRPNNTYFSRLCHHITVFTTAYHAVHKCYTGMTTLDAPGHLHGYDSRVYTLDVPRIYTDYDQINQFWYVGTVYCLQYITPHTPGADFPWSISPQL